MRWGANSDLAHFYTAFNNSLVLVFVRHEDELNQVPESVRKASLDLKKAVTLPTWRW